MSNLIERSEHIATLTLSNPGKLNALDASMWAGLTRTLTELSQDESLRCVVLRGAGENFAAGADIADVFHSPRHARTRHALSHSARCAR